MPSSIPISEGEPALPEFDLGALGWNPELAEQLTPGHVPGRVVAAHRAAYDVQTAGEVVRTRLPGRLMHESVEVAVGDWVGLGDGLIRSVLPRRSAIVRKSAGLTSEAQTLAANIDVAFVVTSLGPDLEPRRIERYLVTIWESGASPEVVLTKADRMDDPWELVAEVEAVALGVPVHVVSAVTGQGVDALRARIGDGRDRGADRLERRRQVDAREPLGRARAHGGEGDARGRRRGASHDRASGADRAAGRRRRDRHARDPRAAAVGQRGARRGVRGRRGARD